MSQIILPKRNKISDVEEVVAPAVRCSFCEKMTTTGMKQSRLNIVEKGSVKVIGKKTMYKPPRAEQIDYYMCTECIKKGTKWPGRRP